MTIFELFPWLLAICIVLLSTIGLRRLGIPELYAYSIGIIFGVAVWLFVLFLRKRGFLWLQQKSLARERSANKNRKYQELEQVRDYPKGKDLFYECIICGNVVPSMPKTNTSCKCRNILVETKPGRVEIQNRAKAKLFTSASP